MLMHLLVIAKHKFNLAEAITTMILAHMTASTEKMNFGCTWSSLAGYYINGHLDVITTYRSMTPSGPKSAAALTQIPPIAVVAKHAATFA